MKTCSAAQIVLLQPAVSQVVGIPKSTLMYPLFDEWGCARTCLRFPTVSWVRKVPSGSLLVVSSRRHNQIGPICPKIVLSSSSCLNIVCMRICICVFVSTASGALVVGGVSDTSHPIPSIPSHPPEIALSVQWSRTNQSVAVSGSLW